mmetsp:Transcript_11734/g.28113  ORF Transcript_11734/g.28113 Transcript_11734/m.28113 type:complete len:87 (+) Transcript_11734:777-1037(+)
MIICLDTVPVRRDLVDRRMPVQRLVLHKGRVATEGKNRLLAFVSMSLLKTFNFLITKTKTKQVFIKNPTHLKDGLVLRSCSLFVVG